MGVSRLNKERDDAIDAIEDSRTDRTSRCRRARPGICVLRESRERISQLPHLSAGRLPGGDRHTHHGDGDHHANPGAAGRANAAGAAPDLDRDGWCSSDSDHASGVTSRRPEDAGGAAPDLDRDGWCSSDSDHASGVTSRRPEDAGGAAPDLDRDGWHRVAGATAVSAPHNRTVNRTPPADRRRCPVRRVRGTVCPACSPLGTHASPARAASYAQRAGHPSHPAAGTMGGRRLDMRCRSAVLSFAVDRARRAGRHRRR